MPEEINNQGTEVATSGNTMLAEGETHEHGPAIMKWTCKMREVADKHINFVQFGMFMSTTGVVGMGFYVLRDNLEKNMDDLLIISFGMYVIFGLFTLILRQKTVYNYPINEEQGECESYLYFPSFAGALFNGIAILGFVVVLAAAIMMQSLIPLLGAGAVGLSYAGRLLGWQPTITVDQSLLWKEYGCITLDYKRKMIVAHKTNIDIGFEFRFPDEKLFAEFLDFLKPRLRSDVEFLKRDWDAENFRRNWAKANKK